MFKQELYVLKRAFRLLPLTKKSQRSKFIKRLRVYISSYVEKINKTLHEGLLLVLHQEVKTKSTLNKNLKLFSLFITFTLYLFLSPHGAVNAVFPEKVIPPKTEKAVVTINEQVTIEKVPTFKAPVRGYISTRFSAFHQGIDIPNPVGTPILPVTEGEVTFAGYSNAGYGNLVIIKHKLGYESLYAHLSKIDVGVGQKVQENTLIGRVGSTGFSTGNHLHLEIHIDGVAVNPLRFVSP